MYNLCFTITFIIILSRTTLLMMLMSRYNAIINPLRPRLSKFKTILIAGITWLAGNTKYFCFILVIFLLTICAKYYNCGIVMPVKLVSERYKAWESLKGFGRKIYNIFAPSFKLKQQLPLGAENNNKWFLDKKIDCILHTAKGFNWKI